MSKKFAMKFDPQTIEHLGVKMYSTLPPALAELISNAYDADAENVALTFNDVANKKTIYISDDGTGMSSDDIEQRFLVIGRNRRRHIGDVPSPRFKRLATGKKGLGKLALFGLAKIITIDTIKDKKRNRFTLDWDKLLSADGTYNPEVEISDQETDKKNGTSIILSKLKRQSPFDLDSIADSLSKLFIVDMNFKISLVKNRGSKIYINQSRRYNGFTKQFEWNLENLIPVNSTYINKLSGVFYTSDFPIKPNSGLRGVSLFSRGKLVNAPEYFSNSTSSHFFQYLTGSISADFIDDLSDDVISTNRQSIDWDHDDMQELREFLSTIISQINNEWRIKRKKKKDDQLKQISGINTSEWIKTLPEEMREHTETIIRKLGDEDAIEQYAPVIQALHAIIPEYPMLHWRHLNEKLKDRIKSFYVNGNYAFAADQSVKIYCETLREMTNLDMDGTDLMDHVWSQKNPKIKICDTSTDSGKNIQVGQHSLAKGMVQAFRNPFNHMPVDKFTPAIYSELDCLNILSLVSYLTDRLENAEILNEDK